MQRDDHSLCQKSGQSLRSFEVRPDKTVQIISNLKRSSIFRKLLQELAPWPENSLHLEARRPFPFLITDASVNMVQDDRRNCPPTTGFTPGGVHRTWTAWPAAWIRFRRNKEQRNQSILQQFNALSNRHGSAIGIIWIPDTPSLACTREPVPVRGPRTKSGCCDRTSLVENHDLNCCLDFSQWAISTSTRLLSTCYGGTAAQQL